MTIEHNREDLMKQAIKRLMKISFLHMAAHLERLL
ncbi:hypothetical protein J2T20_003265 [Paenibacillus wynnii]|nr:hypothetical protein [Paenibacillus wynnii]